MKEAEIAALKRDKEIAERAMNAYNAADERNNKTDDNETREATRQRGNGSNGEENNTEDGKVINLRTNETIVDASQARSCTEENDADRSAIDEYCKPDGNDSPETRSCNGDSPLIDASRYAKSVEDETRDRRVNDLLDGISSSKNSYTISHDDKSRNRRESKNVRALTNEDNREADDRTRFRVYRDEEEAESEVERSGGKNKTRGISESDDMECLDIPSETNSNEFEMISNHLESEDSRDNSLETLRVEKITLKNGRNGSLAEEANLIT